MENQGGRPPLRRSDFQGQDTPRDILTVNEFPAQPHTSPMSDIDKMIGGKANYTFRYGISDKNTTGVRSKGDSEKWGVNGLRTRSSTKEGARMGEGGEEMREGAKPTGRAGMEDGEKVREETKAWLKEVTELKERSASRETRESREEDCRRGRAKSIEDMRTKLREITRSRDCEKPTRQEWAGSTENVRTRFKERARSTEEEGVFETDGSRRGEGKGRGGRTEWREGVGTRLMRERAESKEGEGALFRERARPRNGEWGRQRGRSESVERMGKGRLYPMLPGELWELGPETTRRPLPPATCPRVQVRVVFLKIGEIDTMREQFCADVFLQARWRDPSLDGQEGKTPSRIDFSSRWNPRIKIINTMGEVKESVWQEVNFDHQGHAFILDRRRLIANFSESLELENFPLDIQYLSIHVASELGDTELVLVEDEEEPSFINMDNFVDAQEWKLRALVEVRPRLLERELSSMQHRVPCLLVQCVAFRRAGFFLWNILCVMAWTLHHMDGWLWRVQK